MNEQENAAHDLAVAAKRVLEAFQSGRNPTSDELEMLERTIQPFFAEKICGHAIFEDCGCLEIEHGA